MRALSVKPKFFDLEVCFSFSFAEDKKHLESEATNIILDESYKRVYSTKEGARQLAVDLYIIRGDNINVVGEIDEELDSSLDLSKLRAHPPKPVIH